MIIKNYDQPFNEIAWKNYCISKRNELIKLYTIRMGDNSKLNLDNPQTITDKINWLKIYDATYLKIRANDKVELRNYCKEVLGKDICPKILKIYNNFDEINFDELPNNYILKTNHGSHSNIIVKNKNINKVSAKKQFNDWLSKDWTFWGLEMTYEPIPRKIFAEEYLETGNDAITDYKFLCFNGEPKIVQIMNNRFTNKFHCNYYDMDGIKLDISRIDIPSNDINDSMPINFDLMKKYAKKLSNDFKFVRVDFYEVNGQIYLSELTFYPAAGYLKYKNPQTNLLLGNMLKLD